MAFGSVPTRPHLSAGGFSLYEFMVNMIPGIVFLVLLHVLVPMDIVDTYYNEFDSFIAPILLLVGGFVVGRLIQGVSGWSVIDGFAERVAAATNIRVEDHYTDFEARLRAIDEDGDDDNLETSICGQIKKDLSSSTLWEGENWTSGENGQSNEDNGSPGNSDNYVIAKHLSDSLVYRKGLAWKYGVLMTFFRNLWVVFFGLGVMFLLKPFLFPLIFQGNETVILAITAMNGPESDRFIINIAVPALKDFGIATLLFFSAVIAIRQRFTFKRRFNRASIIELFIAMRELAPEGNDDVESEIVISPILAQSTFARRAIRWLLNRSRALSPTWWRRREW